MVRGKIWRLYQRITYRNYLTSLIHKGRTLNPKVIPAEQVLEMATINGAKCALLEREIGSLEVG
ncbi:MAG: amidohydrolase family protein, partial [Sarcina sp.]